MRFVVFGLTASSAWGNGHATLWRGLARALAGDGHSLEFFERDVPWYAAHRDATELPGGALRLYARLDDVLARARSATDAADVAMVTSYCPDARAATDLVLSSRAGLKVFYDLDTGVTLARLAAREPVEWVGPRGLGDFDLVLSFTGGKVLRLLRERLGARRAAALHGAVDPEVHRPSRPAAEFRGDLSWLGTWAPSRQAALEALFLGPAARMPDRTFVLAGAMYDASFPWRANVRYVRHLEPALHPAFFCSSPLTVNVTRAEMAAVGHCPSPRLFEAAACGVPVLSDGFDGLDAFFAPGEEILVARDADEAADAVARPRAELARIGRRARERALAEHTAEARARELVALCEGAARGAAGGAGGRSPRRRSRGRAPRRRRRRRRMTWGIVPAAGAGSRIQPLAFSKELLPVGSQLVDGTERPRAVSEYLVERMLAGGATRLCFVISPGKSDIVEYYGGTVGAASICYAVQPRPAGLCDAVFRALPFVAPGDDVLVGLPDTVWFPADGFCALPAGELSFLLFPVRRPELFDAVVHAPDGAVREIQVKAARPATRWIWGAFRATGALLAELHGLWRARGEQDAYVGTLVNAWIAGGGSARAVRAGEAYVDVGTLHGWHEALAALRGRGAVARPAEPGPADAGAAGAP